MKPVTQWQADDGSVWPSDAAALRRDAMIVACKALEVSAGLRPIPTKGTEFANGQGYVQQPSGAKEKLYAGLKALGVNRDSEGPLGQLLYRWHSIDGMDREWGQPYFAMNPTKGEQHEYAKALTPIASGKNVGP